VLQHAGLTCAGAKQDEVHNEDIGEIHKELPGNLAEDTQAEATKILALLGQIK